MILCVCPGHNSKRGMAVRGFVRHGLFANTRIRFSLASSLLPSVLAHAGLFRGRGSIAKQGAL